MTARRTIIVDDDPGIRIALVRAFQRKGWEASGEETAAAGLDAIRAQDPDIVLLDKDLPDGTGIEMARTLRGESRDVPVVLITAYASVQSALESMELRIAAYLTKPFDDIFDVVRKVESIVERRATLEKLRVLRVAPRERSTPRFVILSRDWDSLGRMATELGEYGNVKTLTEAEALTDELGDGARLCLLVDRSVGDDVVLESLRMVRAAGLHPEPIMVVSGEPPTTQQIADMVSAGAQDFVERGYEQDSLRRRVDRLMKQRWGGS